MLNALCARNLQLTVRAASGVRMELLNDYAKTGEWTWRLPDLAYGSEAWVLVRLHRTVAKVAALGVDGGTALVTGSVCYDDLGGEPRAIEPQSLALKALSAAAFGAIAEDPLVKRRAVELEAAQIQQTARKAALAGDWASVEQLLGQADKLGADNEWVREVVVELRRLASRRDEAMFAKESMYSSVRMASRLAPVNEASMSATAAVPDYVRRKKSQGKRDPRTPRSPR